MSDTSQTRLSGILLHPTSLPSPYGIGDLWKEAYAFIDFLEASGQHLWQILPLTPTGFGDSPYQSFSAFAGQPLLVSPEHLVELGLLRVEDLEDCPKGNGESVDYGAMIPWKTRILRMAAGRFEKIARTELRNEYQKFVSANLFWLYDYALYMSCKDHHEGKSWLDWGKAYRKPTASVKKRMKKQFAEDIKYYYFVQFMFHKDAFREILLNAIVFPDLCTEQFVKLIHQCLFWHLHHTATFFDVCRTENGIGNDRYRIDNIFNDFSFFYRVVSCIFKK